MTGHGECFIDFEIEPLQVGPRPVLAIYHHRRCNQCKKYRDEMDALISAFKFHINT